MDARHALLEITSLLPSNPPSKQGEYAAEPLACLRRKDDAESHDLECHLGCEHGGEHNVQDAQNAS
jgi:hypothetical protein